MAASVERALRLIKDMPRVCMNNIRDMPKARRKKDKRRSLKKAGTHGRKDNGQAHTGTLPALGVEGMQFPFYLRIPKEPYNKDHFMKKQYPPISMLQLQRLIDLGRLDPMQPIDLTDLCNTGLFRLQVEQRHYGFNLTDEGADIFAARVNLEVQWTSELCIAAVERNGGTITTRFYDPPCLLAKRDVRQFFARGVPIPRCKFPPHDLIDYYTNASNRGYLSDPDEVRQRRLKLAQKYGYELADLSGDASRDMLLQRKDPIQIFHGLEPGWVVNLRDRHILKPTDKELVEYYTGQTGRPDSQIRDVRDC